MNSLILLAKIAIIIFMYKNTISQNIILTHKKKKLANVDATIKSIKSKGKIFNVFSNSNGEIKFDKNLETIFLVLKKEGFKEKGLILDLSQELETIQIELESEKSTIIGKIVANDISKENVKIKLINLETEEIITTKSDRYGLFKFNEVDIAYKYILEIYENNFLPIKKIIEISRANTLIKEEIRLKEDNIDVLVKLSGNNIENRYVSIENISLKTNSKGIASTKINRNTEKIKIFVDNKIIFKHVNKNRDINYFYIDVENID
jgi:hypothetical protein